MDNSQIDVIVGKQAFEQVGKLDKDLQELYKTYLKLFEVSQKMSKNPLAVKSTGEAKNRVKELSTNSERLNAVLKEQDRLEKALIRSLAQKELAESATAKAVARTREEVRQKNLETKRAAIQSSQELGAYKKLSNTLNKLRQEYKDVAAAQGVGSKQAQTLQKRVIALDSSLKRIDQSAGQFGRTVGNYPTAFKGAARSLRSLVGAFGFVGGIQLFASAVKNSFDRIRQFDKAMQNIAGIMRTSRKDISDLEKEIIKVAGSSIKTSNEVAELAENLVTLGKTKEEIKDLLKPVNDLAIGLETTSGESAEFLVQMLNTFGASTDEAAKYADVIATIRTSTSLDFQRMRDSFQYLAPISRVLNRDLAYTGSLIGILSDNGIKAERAGRLLGTAQQKLASSGKSLNDALEEINSSVQSGSTELETLALASELMGKQSASLGVVLANNTELIDKNAEAIRNNSGALDDLTNQQLESLDAKLKILDSTWEQFLLGIENGEGAISDFFKEAISGATTLLKMLDKLNESQTDINEDAFSRGSDSAKKEIDRILNSDILPGEFKESDIELKRSQAVKDLNKGYTDLRENLMKQKPLIERLKQLDEDRNLLNAGLRNIQISSVKSELESLQESSSKLQKDINFRKGLLEEYAAYQLKGVETEKGVVEEKEKEITETTETQLKKRDDSFKDSYALKKYLLEQEIEFNEEVLSDEDNYYSERMNSLETFHDKTLELAELERDNNLRGLVEGSDAAKLVWEKYYNEVIGITKDYNSKLKDIQATPLEVLDEDDNIEEVDNTLAVRNLAEQLGFDPDMVLKEYEKFNDEMKRLYGEDYKSFTEFQELKKQGAEDVKEARLQFERDLSDGVQSIIDSMFQFELQKYDDLIVANNEYYSNRLDNQNLSEEQRSQIEAERDARNIELEKKRQELERKAFLFQQGAAAAEIVIETVKAVAAIKAQAAIYTASGLFPLASAATAQIPYVIGSGAIATAAILGESIKAFKTGKKESDNYEGIALLNDGGRDEVRVDKYGNASLIQGRNVLSHVAKDDIIYPSVSEFNKSMGNSLMVTNVLASQGAKSDDLKMVLNGFRSEMKESVKDAFKNARITNHVHVNSFDRKAYINSKKH
jgi:hypothetical protein